MPLGVCGTCGRAFVFESACDKGQDCCPECRTPLRVTTIRELRSRWELAPVRREPRSIQVWHAKQAQA